MARIKSRIAQRHVNILDVVLEEPRVTQPRFMVIQRVDRPAPVRSTSIQWPEWDESTLADLVGSGLQGQ